MRSARRLATLVVTLCSTAVLVGLAPVAHAAPAADDGTRCLMYNDQTVICIHYR